MPQVYQRLWECGSAVPLKAAVVERNCSIRDTCRIDFAGTTQRLATAQRMGAKMSGNSFDFNDSSNPYAADEPSEFGNPSASLPDKRGMVGHVPVIGILLIVQGVLQLIMGAYLLALPFFLSEFLDEQLQNNPAIQQ